MTLRLLRPGNLSRPVIHALKTSTCRSRVNVFAIVAAREQPRSYSAQNSTSEPPPPRSGFSPLFSVLLCGGLGAVAYGVYDVYQTMTLWPPEVRKDLRAGLSAKSKDDFELSEQYLRRAWETTKTLPVELFKTQPYLKISGVAVCLAGVLESNNGHEKAYDIYMEALTRMQDIDSKGGLSGPERLRAISIAYRLGEMAAALQRPGEEERHLSWAVETILRSIQDNQQTAGNVVPTHESNIHTMASGLELPVWATKTDIAAPFEALGSFYAQSGKLDYAMPLYLQAISILIPPPPHDASIEDRCRGAQLMSNLSEVIVRSQHDLDSKSLDQAEAWATKALDIVMHSKESISTPHPTCEVAFAVALFNVAALRRMAGDQENAKHYFSLSLKQSKAIGMQAGVQHAEDALHQLTGPDAQVHN